jgi:hypothetical protein
MRVMAAVHIGHHRLVHRVVEQLERVRPVEPVPRWGIGAEMPMNSGLYGCMPIINGFGPGQITQGNAGVGTESK